MSEVWVGVKSVLASIGFVLGFILGDVNGLLLTLCAFMVLDYVTGVISAVITKTLSSEVGFKGLARKGFILVLVGVGNLIDVHVLGFAGVRTMVIMWYLANEGLSILENSVRLGLPVPAKLRSILEQLQRDGKDDSISDNSMGM